MEALLQRPNAVALGSRTRSCASALRPALPVRLQGRRIARLAICARSTASRDSLAAPSPPELELGVSNAELTDLQRKAQLRRLQRASEQATYQVSAAVASLGVTALAVAAVYYRFSWHIRADGEIPWLDIASTLLLVGGGMVGMEFYARWAHKALWHDFQPGWALHESHHKPRVGPFEANDLFAVMNAVPAMGLCAYGFLRPDVVGGLCFGAGLGITLFGISYLYVHDGLVHKRFPVGPLAQVPYLKRVAVAHKLHHSDKFGGVPFGLFLGPGELEAVGAKEELDKMVQELEL